MLSEIQRDLASTELWQESFERSLRRRALAPIARKREARRKRTSLVAGAAVATAPMLPSLGAADAASSPGTHDHGNSHKLQNQTHERILLRRGDTNASVGALQRALDITVDDIFGPQTEAAVRTMQQRHGLPPTGKVDPRTWLTLFPHDAIIAVTGPTPPGSSRNAQATAQWAAVTVPSVPHAASKSATAHMTNVASAASAAGPVVGHGSGGVQASLIGASQHAAAGGVQASLIGASQRAATAPQESTAPQSPSSAAPRAATPPTSTPAPTTVSVPGSTGGQAIQIQAPTPGSAQTAAEMVAEMIAAANAIDAHHYAYSWGGGHNSSFSGPYDCSGAVSAVLHAAGLVSAPMVSGDYMRWGTPGPGTVTIYANAGHVYMSINGKFFGTSYTNPGGGAGWYQGGARPGFVVVHVPFEKMHLRTSAARVQAAKARRQQRRQPTAVAAVQPRTSGTTVVPAAGTTTGNGGTAYVGASAPAAAQPPSAAGAPGTAATVAPSADAPAAVAPSSDTSGAVAPASTPAPVAPSSSTPAPVAPSSSTPAPVAPSSSTPVTVAPSTDTPAAVAPSSSVSVPAAAPAPTPDVAPAPASAPDTTSPTAAPAPSTPAPAPAASAPTTATSSVEPASAATPTPPATQPAAPTDPPTGDAAGTPATDTAAPAADPGAQSQASAPATSTSDASASAPATAPAAA